MKENSQQKRQVAYKLGIKDIISSDYVKEEGWNPNYIVLKEGKQASRVDVIGTVIDKKSSTNPSYQTLIIDNGSGVIAIRSFENDTMMDNTKIGDSVLIIGRPREFAKERYLLPEIIKKIDDINWVKLRDLEVNSKEKAKENKIEVYDVQEELVLDDSSIIPLIRQLDKGQGADLNDIIEKSRNKDIEKIIDTMVKKGDLFEIRPGKIKILE